MKLKVYPSGDLDLIMEREFTAPRELVFDAWTKPELVKKWLGVRNGWEFVTCEIDFRVGGTYRYVWRKAGKDLAMGGTYKEIARPEKYIHSELFDDPWYPGEGLITNEFLVLGDKRTLYKSTNRAVSKEARDAVLASPMATGVEESFIKLDGLLT